MKALLKSSHATVFSILVVFKKPLRARGTRPVRNHSQTVAFVNQLLDRDALQADSIPLDKSEHFSCGFALRTVCSIRAPRSVFSAENLQSFANHFLDAVEVDADLSTTAYRSTPDLLPTQ